MAEKYMGIDKQIIDAIQELEDHQEIIKGGQDEKVTEILNKY